MNGIVPTPPDLAARPRVCLLHDYRESAHRSMKRYAERLGDELERLGWGVERVRPPDLVPAPLLRVPLVGKIDSYAGRFLAYPRIARRLRADVYHVIDHGQGFLVDHLDASRTVVTCHDVILLVLASGRLGRRARPPFAIPVLRRSVRAMRGARKIVAVSEQTRRDLAEHADVDPARVTVIPPGLNREYRPMPEAREPTRKRFGLGDGALVLHVGHTGFYKNVEGCLRVLARLRSGGIDATLARAGSPMTRDQARLAGRLGVGEHVRDLGPLGDADLAALYASADVLLFPSLYEGFGWPPLEAMASGLPVISSRGGALPEVVGDAALTAGAEDVDALAAHVAAVLGDPAVRSALRARGLTRAARFDWARTASEIAKVYGAIVEG